MGGNWFTNLSWSLVKGEPIRNPKFLDILGRLGWNLAKGEPIYSPKFLDMLRLLKAQFGIKHFTYFAPTKDLPHRHVETENAEEAWANLKEQATSKSYLTGGASLGLGLRCHAMLTKSIALSELYIMRRGEISLEFSVYDESLPWRERGRLITPWEDIARNVGVPPAPPEDGFHFKLEDLKKLDKSLLATLDSDVVGLIKQLMRLSTDFEKQLGVNSVLFCHYYSD